MILNGFAGRMVDHVEKENGSVRVVFRDGGFLFVRAKGPDGTWLKLSCSRTRCKPSRCARCRGMQPEPSE